MGVLRGVFLKTDVRLKQHAALTSLALFTMIIWTELCVPAMEQTMYDLLNKSLGFIPKGSMVLLVHVLT